MMKWKLGFLIGVMFILSIALIDPCFGQRNLLISHSRNGVGNIHISKGMKISSNGSTSIRGKGLHQ
ncbi:unnamed protein product [Brassica rapa subsp. narinosa]|uniref:(rape) hypothetical protein n=1 Tax=Brassica napus TaxID=3708 RepID=A0A816TWN3_BRANA|nr:unnamed protein product [Brassica napus]